ncbi:GntR family transcriptional regulator [Lactobacillus sp. YT155]|uniref:GntR family transcriptional regulator n=1 Tax=Lactobacillus sp. YT155 TaxID=3060955 RepID=UPI00265E8083|nr:GntR family transcriptional regulator [Lactobacillus sp. YT155]MDO1604678.1 GntR family transcriptional regulator [Lactobacillus sp. YT155]
MEYREISPTLKSEEDLKLQVRRGLSSGKYDLPSERSLAEKTNISRTSIRKSIKTLEREDLIKKDSRKGMEINKKHTINLLSAKSLSDELNIKTDQVSTVVLNNEFVEGNSEIIEFLKTSSSIFCLTRKRLINDEIFSFEQAYLNGELFPGIEKINFENKSLYEILKNKYQTIPEYGHETINVKKSDDFLSSMLNVELQTPLFEVVSKSFDASDQPFEYSTQYLIGSKVNYRLEAKNIFDYKDDLE